MIRESRAASLDGLQIRRRLGRETWLPPEPFGPDGWLFDSVRRDRRIIVSVANHDGAEWIHASISRRAVVPDYGDLQLLQRTVFGGGWAYQVFAPPTEHINIHPFCLHLWGRLDGASVLPNFGEWGSI